MTNSSTRKLTKITSLYSLVNASVSVRVGSGNNQRTINYTSPLQDPSQQPQLLPLLLDETTVSPNAELMPRINVNTASQVVLSTLPGLTDSDVQAILTNRPQLSDMTTPDPSYQTPAWLIAKAGLTVAKLKTLENYITARTQVYRVQSLGYASGGGPVARVEAVVDTNQGRPRILYWRDLSELGRGFDVGPSSNNSGPGTKGPNRFTRALSPRRVWLRRNKARGGGTPEPRDYPGGNQPTVASPKPRPRAGPCGDRHLVTLPRNRLGPAAAARRRRRRARWGCHLPPRRRLARGTVTQPDRRRRARPPPQAAPQGGRHRPRPRLGVRRP